MEICTEYIPDYVLYEEVQGVDCIYLTMCSLKKSRGWTVYTWLCALWRSPELYKVSMWRYIQGVNMEINTGCQYGNIYRCKYVDMYRVSIWRYVQGVNMEIYTGCQYGDIYRVSIWRYIQFVNIEIYTGCKYGDIYRV